MDNDLAVIRQALNSRNQLHSSNFENDKWKHRTNMEKGYQVLAIRMRNNSIPNNVIGTITMVMSCLRNDKHFTDIDVDFIIGEIRPYFPDNTYCTY